MDSELSQNQKGEFVQILHDESYHWVVVSNINCTKNKRNYYDGLLHGGMEDHVKMQICNMCKYFEEDLMFDRVSSNRMVLTVEFTKLQMYFT